jgi:ABC-2 type transport system ATP-binding protein
MLARGASAAMPRTPGIGTDEGAVPVGDETVIECRRLSRRFGARLAVDHLDLVVDRGQVFGFLGPNGSGKSTTIRMLLGLIAPTEGEALLFGAPAAQRREVLRRVGALVERPSFYDYLSGRRNLELLCSLSGGCEAARIDRVLALVGMADRQGDRVGGYSHGMRQRLGLAQALLPAPELVILDEPATGLDPEGLVDIRNLLRRMAAEEGMTIFLSSHLLAEVQSLCTHVGLLARGKLLRCGPVAALLGGGGDGADVTVDDPVRALEVLGRVAQVIEAARGQVDGTVNIRVEPGGLAQANAALVGAGVQVSALVPRLGNLEDLYMSVMREAGHVDAG